MSVSESGALPGDRFVMRAAVTWAHGQGELGRVVRDAVAGRDGAYFGLLDLWTGRPEVPFAAIMADAREREIAAAATAA